MKTTVITCVVYVMTAFAMGPTLSRAAAGEPAAPDPFQKQVLPLLERYCVDCHMNDEFGGGDRPRSLRESGRRPSRTAGPGSACGMRFKDASCRRPTMPQPSLEERDRIIGWIENDFLAAQCGQAGQFGAGRDPAAEPAGVRQHDPRPARAGSPPGGCLPAG